MRPSKSIAKNKGPISGTFKAWCGAGSNRRHKDFQSFALPTELPHQLPKFYIGVAKIGLFGYNFEIIRGEILKNFVNRHYRPGP